ncbi:MAG: right-handed parallel beta-helix repeat-containing protein [Myxococcota bacterium]
MAQSPGRAVEILDSDSVRMADCRFLAARDDTTAVRAVNSERVVVTSCVFEDYGAAHFAWDSTTGQISHNVIVGGGDGMRIANSSNVTMHSNRICELGGSAIDIASSTEVTVSFNTMIGNRRGLIVSELSRVRLDSSLVVNSLNASVQVDSGSSVESGRNLFFGNAVGPTGLVGSNEAPDISDEPRFGLVPTRENCPRLTVGVESRAFSYAADGLSLGAEVTELALAREEPPALQDTVVIEAEAAELGENFTTSRDNEASGAAVAQAIAVGAPSALGFRFPASEGRYDIRVVARADNTTESIYRLWVDQAAVAQWQTDEIRDSPPGEPYESIYVMRGVSIARQAQISLDACPRPADAPPSRVECSEAGSAAAVDRFEFFPVDTLPAETLLLEAESEQFALTNYERNETEQGPPPPPSGGFWLEVESPTAGDASATAPFPGEAGVYDVRVDYYDENDGASRFFLDIDETTVREWVWNDSTPSDQANMSTFVSRWAFDVSIDAGSPVTFGGSADGVEPLRVDVLRFFRVDGR